MVCKKLIQAPRVYLITYQIICQFQMICISNNVKLADNSISSANIELRIACINEAHVFMTVLWNFLLDYNKYFFPFYYIHNMRGAASIS